MATTIFGPVDVLNQAGRFWDGESPGRRSIPLDVKIASADGGAISTLDGVELLPQCGINDVEDVDLIVIASATQVDEILRRAPGLVDWIRHHHSKGAHVASICTGVFLLAESGLLDGKTATLHWGFVHEFKLRYPHIALEPDRIFLDHGRVYCSAGVTAGMDLSLYLVEKFCGRAAARQSAKTMVLGMDRRQQTPYGSMVKNRVLDDPVVAGAQEWIEENQARSIDYNELAAALKISRRSLERRFKNRTGTTPLAYLQQLRVEKAKQMLEQGRSCFAHIAHAVGYEDVSFFRKLFIRLTGLKPKEYQEKFAGYLVDGSSGDLFKGKSTSSTS